MIDSVTAWESDPTKIPKSNENPPSTKRSWCDPVWSWTDPDQMLNLGIWDLIRCRIPELNFGSCRALGLGQSRSDPEAILKRSFSAATWLVQRYYLRIQSYSKSPMNNEKTPLRDPDMILMWSWNNPSVRIQPTCAIRCSDQRSWGFGPNIKPEVSSQKKNPDWILLLTWKIKNPESQDQMDLHCLKRWNKDSCSYYND